MNHDSACGRCRDLLPEYAAGTLSPAGRAAVERHLATCAACSRELAAWDALAGAARDVSQTTPPPALPFEASWDLLAVRLADPLPDTAGAQRSSASLAPLASLAAVGSLTDTTSAPPPSPSREHLPQTLAAFMTACGHIVRVMVAQARLLRPAVWLASALAITLAVLYALTLPRVIGERDVLAFALPLIAATGVAFLYGPDIDAALELALATPTSPRLVLLGRFALLFGYDTALALAGTLALALVRHDTFAALTSVWFGPMALLSTLSLALSLLLGTAVAIAGAVALWLSRTLRLDDGLALHISASAFWPTTPQILVLSLALLTAALLYVPRQERLRPDYDL